MNTVLPAEVVKLYPKLIPANLRAVGITDDRNFEVMAKKACEGSKGSFVPLSKDDIVEIYRAAF